MSAGWNNQDAPFLIFRFLWGLDSSTEIDAIHDEVIQMIQNLETA